MVWGKLKRNVNIGNKCYNYMEYKICNNMIIIKLMGSGYKKIGNWFVRKNFNGVGKLNEMNQYEKIIINEKNEINGGNMICMVVNMDYIIIFWPRR